MDDQLAVGCNKTHSLDRALGKQEPIKRIPGIRFWIGLGNSVAMINWQ